MPRVSIELVELSDEQVLYVMNEVRRLEHENRQALVNRLMGMMRSEQIEAETEAEDG